MKTSIDLPDELYRRVKSKSALEGKTVREVATALFSAWVADSAGPTAGPAISGVQPADQKPDAAAPQALWLQTWQQLSSEIDSAMQGRGGLVEQLQDDRK